MNTIVTKFEGFVKKNRDFLDYIIISLEILKISVK